MPTARSERGEWQGVPEVNDDELPEDEQLLVVDHDLMPNPDTGSPVVSFEWTVLKVALDAEATELLTHVLVPSLSEPINQAPTFDESIYAFTIAEAAADGDAVGGVSATDEDAGDTVTYAITAGNTGDAFAIDADSGAITVAGALDRETTAEYSLEVQASDGNGGEPTVTVTVTVVATPAVTVAFGQATDTATEGAAGVTVTVTLSADPLRNVTIPLTVTRQGGAEAADHSDVPASVSYVAGETSTSFVVVAEDDAVDDDGESLTLGFGTLPARVTAGTQATTTISLADDDLPAVTVAYGAATYAATEGAAAGVTVTVTLSADPERDVTIPLTVTLQSGAEAADHSGVPASVGFATGETSKTFVVVAEDDAVDDDGESLLLGFGDLPARVTAGTQATTTVSLEDDDVPAVTVAYGQAAYTATEGAATGVTVTVTLNADPERDVTIPLTATLQGGAEAADYSGVPADVSFATGETSKTFVVVAVDDALSDDGESLLLGFGDLPARVTAGTQATTTISLADDEVPAVTASVSGAPATHDGQTAFTFELQFSEEVAVGFRKLRDEAFEVTGGSVIKARRLVQGSNQGWEITVDPQGQADVTVVLPVTTDCTAAGAICTGDGRKLSERVEFTVTT